MLITHLKTELLLKTYKHIFCTDFLADKNEDTYFKI